MVGGQGEKVFAALHGLFGLDLCAEAGVAGELHIPEAADRWTRTLVVAHTQLRHARPPRLDLSRPWEGPITSDRLTPARVRRRFRNIRTRLACPTRVPEPRGGGPGRPSGAKCPSVN
ncbi:hypothetical protein GCM10010129_58520 [Streptomyces fumigatiscleroticus]|nr:hypothetical protein GCM10010129_58520 [Streptomyces fumigatiscleroticus]